MYDKTKANSVFVMVTVIEKYIKFSIYLLKTSIIMFQRFLFKMKLFKTSNNEEILIKNIRIKDNTIKC